MDISIYKYLVSFFFIDRKFKHKLNIKWKYSESKLSGSLYL